ncbi:PDDEXK nuclease domain-containing protein [Rhodococcus sp. NM-2]|uniref:PDDEXK nuclease domain-containing protein n=1 Tax=Rhodococcus TaxID=1827 RepID=UPI003AB039E3
MRWCLCPARRRPPHRILQHATTAPTQPRLHAHPPQRTPRPNCAAPCCARPAYSERDLDDALIGRLAHFLSDFGARFSSVGRQYQLSVGNSDFYLEVGRGRSLMAFAGKSAAVCSVIRTR